jgi:putative membrane protein insertion efficiency factor
MRSPARAILLASIRFYRSWIGPALPPSCRFEPSCSAYGLESITHFGALRGGYLTVRRVLRCHPWHRGGTDPVPRSFSLRYRPDLCASPADERTEADQIDAARLDQLNLFGPPLLAPAPTRA